MGRITLLVKRYPSILPPLGYALIRVLGWTLRIRTLHAERVRAFWESGRGVIIAFWHSRQLMMPLCYGGSRLYILISEHRDGEPIWVSRDADRVQLEAKRVEVEAALNKLGDEADHAVGQL